MESLELREPCPIKSLRDFKNDVNARVAEPLQLTKAFRSIRARRFHRSLRNTSMAECLFQRGVYEIRLHPSVRLPWPRCGPVTAPRIVREVNLSHYDNARSPRKTRIPLSHSKPNSELDFAGQARVSDERGSRYR